MESFCWKDHSHSLLSEISRLYAEEIDVDCCFLIENKWLKAHKVILCASSSYFKDLFANSSGTTLVTFQDITYSDMKCILNYIYYGVVQVPSDQKESFINACSLLQLKAFKGLHRSNLVSQTSQTDDAYNNEECVLGDKYSTKSNYILCSDICSLKDRSAGSYGNNFITSCEKNISSLDENFQKCKPREFENDMISDKIIAVHSEVQVEIVDDDSDNCKLIEPDIPTTCESSETRACDSDTVINSNVQPYSELHSIDLNHTDSVAGEEMTFLMEEIVIKCETDKNCDEENISTNVEPPLNAVEVNNILNAKKNINVQLHKDAPVVISPENSIKLEPNCVEILELEQATIEDSEISLESTSSEVCAPSEIRTTGWEEDLERCFCADEGFYRCPFCPSLFLQQKLLSLHLKGHRSEFLVCPECPLVFLTHQTFKKHQNEHKQRLLSCPHCSLNFPSCDDLEKHVLTHGRQKLNENTPISVALDNKRSRLHETCDPMNKKLSSHPEINATRDANIPSESCPSFTTEKSLVVGEKRNAKERHILCKIVSPDGLREEMVKEHNIGEILNAAMIKFNLPDNSYKLVLLDNMTEIKDDEVLKKYCETHEGTCNSPVTLKLSPDFSVTSNTDKTLSTGNIRNTNRGFSRLEEYNSLETINLDCHIWSKAPVRLLDFCRRKKIALPKDRRALVTIIVDYLLFVLKDCRRKACETIAKMICNKYPCTFRDQIGDETYGGGHYSLLVQIYNAALYKKRCIDKESGCSVKRAMDSDDEDETKKRGRSDNYLKQDDYGCVEYFPQMPANETYDGQQQKKLTLLGMYEKIEGNGEEISILMKQTYPSQRASIVSRERGIQSVVNDWPFLKESRFFLEHCGRLLGKNIEETWNCFVGTKQKTLLNYLKAYNFKADRRNLVDKVRQSCLEACISMRSQEPELLLIFPLLVNYFNEDESYFMKVENSYLPDTDVREVPESDCPVLVIRGNSMFDIKCKCTVVLERKIEITCSSILHGILVVFCSYFCFGYLYPLQVEKTLEYIQRAIMKINPPEGHKKAMKKRRKLCFDAAVLKLGKAVAAYENK